MRRALLTLTVWLLATPSYAGEPEAAAQATVGAARAAAKVRSDEGDFERFVRRQAALELQLGLRHYEAREDWRAVTALRRHALLADAPASTYLTSLLIGQIYERNARHEASALSCERALTFAPDPPARAWSFLLSTQQLCLPMSLYVACRGRLAEFERDATLTPKQQELVAYERLFLDVVLRRASVGPERLTPLTDPRLRSHAQALLERDRAFHDLDTKNPWVATSLSLLPGAGQLYNGRPAEAAVAFGLNAGFGALTYFSFAQWDSPPLGVASAVLLAGFYVGNLVNAYTDAERITAAQYQAFFEGLGRAHWPRVGFEVTRGQVSFDYTFDWPGPKARPAPRPSVLRKDEAL